MKRKIFIILAFSLLSSTILLAQDDIRPDYANRRTALLFTFSGLANIGAGNFEGGIGGKLFVNPNLGVRAGLSFVTAKETNPFQNQNGEDGKVSATGFGINAALEYHLASTRVSPYIGGGISLSTLSTESTTAASSAANQVTIKNRQTGENIGGTNYQAGTNFGVFALVGAEFFLYKELSLAAEYRLGYSLTSESDQERSEGNITTTTKGGSITKFGLDSQGFITLAFYF